MDKCPYFEPVEDGEPYAVCFNGDSAGECKPFSEDCRLYQLMMQAHRAILKALEIHLGIRRGGQDDRASTISI